MGTFLRRSRSGKQADGQEMKISSSLKCCTTGILLGDVGAFRLRIDSPCFPDRGWLPVTMRGRWETDVIEMEEKPLYP